MSPLASAGCSPPPQKFLQLMGNPHRIPVSCGPGAGWGTCPWGTAPPALPGWAELSCCGDEQSPRGDAGGASALHLLVPGGSSTAREEEEEEKGLVLVLLGYHKPEVRPCSPQCQHSISHEGPSSAQGTMSSVPGRWRWLMPTPL